MEENVLSFKASFTALVGVLTVLWGWFGWLVVTWICLMCADWLVGSAAAAKRGEWSSEQLREGAWHKCGQVVVVSVSIVADCLIATMLENLPGVSLPFTYEVMVSALVVVWYIFGELGSLVEHAVDMDAPVPTWLSSLLAVGQSAIDTAGDAITTNTESED